MVERKSREEKEEGRSLAPWRPFAELEAFPGFFGEGLFGSRFPRLMDELLREWPGARTRGGSILPAMDVSDDEKQYTVTIELPGSKKEDIHVELHEGMLSIRGEKRSEREEKKEQRRYVERSYGSFSRTLRLPPDADGEHLNATFKEGVLTLTIPKTEEAKPRPIAIKAG